jgi:Family of unknown function (DUF6502)
MLRYLLLPFARFCIRKSLRLQDVTPVFKEVLLQAAREELKRTGVQPSAARLSAMTGVHRKDIRQERSTEELKRLVEHPVVRLISLWRTDRRFSSAKRGPRELRIGSVDSEFSELLRSVGGDLNPYTMLFELERIGAIERKEGKIKLLADAMVDDSFGWDILAEEIGDLMETVEHNMGEVEEAKHLQLKTTFDSIPVEHEEIIRRWLRERGSDFHREVASFLSRYDCDTSDQTKYCTDKLIEVSCSAFSIIRSKSVDRKIT